MYKKIFKILKIIFMIVITIAIVITIPVVSFSARLYNQPPLFEEFKSYVNLNCELKVYANPNINITDCEKWCNDIEKEIPENIKNIVSKYWNIVIAPEGREFRGEETMYLNQEMIVYGYTSLGEKTIYICSSACGMEDLFKTVLVHEIGHSFSFQYGSLDFQNEWLKIYNNNKDKYQPHCDFSFFEYSSSNPAEMFATAFGDYVLKNEALRENNADIYNYMCEIPKLKQNFAVIDKFKYSYNTIKGVFKRGEIT